MRFTFAFPSKEGSNSPWLTPDRLKIGDTIYTTPDEISNRLNHHFCSVGPVLANKISLTDSKFTDYALPLPHVSSLTKTSNDIALKLIQSLPRHKASGLDGISTKMLNEAGPIVSAPLTYIINRSLTTGIFVKDWKVARITPIYKDDIKTNGALSENANPRDSRSYKIGLLV